MANIVITTSFVSHSSFDRPKRKEKDKKSSVKRKVGSRLREKQFLELSKKEQKSYLERFPKSKHRKLLNGDKEGKKEKPEASKKKSKKGEEKNKFTKKISREEFDNLDSKDQKAYKKAYPNDSFTGKKHHVLKKKNIVQQNKTGEFGETPLDGSENATDVKKARQLANKGTKQEREEAKQDLRHSVTPEAVKAVAESTPDDVAQTAQSMKKYRDNNVADIKKSFENKHEQVPIEHEDLEQAKANFEKQIEDDEDNEEWSEDEASATRKLLDRLKPGANNKLSKKDRERLDRVSSKKTKKKKNDPFWKKDIKVLKGIMSGEQVEPDGRSNASLALGLVARYALIAAGGYALAMGAGPAALEVSKALIEQWNDFSIASANAPDGIEDEDEEELSPEDKEDQETKETLGMIYDAVADHIQNMDHDSFVQNISKTFTKFEATAASVSRISYRCLPEERKLPVNQKSQWSVFLGKDCVGRIKADPDAKLRSYNLRIWHPIVLEDRFDPFEFPHLDTSNESTDMNEPFVLTNDEPEEQHNLELHHPSLMTMYEARNFIRNIIHADSSDSIG